MRAVAELRLNRRSVGINMAKPAWGSILELLLEEAARSEVVAWRAGSMHMSTRIRPAGC
jgi:hypothetical protein